MKRILMLVCFIQCAFGFLKAQVSCLSAFGEAAIMDRVICPGGSVVIGPNPQAGRTYSWTPTTSLDFSTVARPEATPTSTTTYTVTVSGASCVTQMRDITVTVANPSVQMASLVLHNGTTLTTSNIPYINYYYYYWENSDYVTLSSNVADNNVWIHQHYLNGVTTYSYSYDQTTTLNFQGTSPSQEGVLLRQMDDLGNTCSTDGSVVATAFLPTACDDISDYPGNMQAVLCPTDLPYTITLPDLGTGSTYSFEYRTSPSIWQFSNVSGRSADLSISNVNNYYNDLYLRSVRPWPSPGTGPYEQYICSYNQGYNIGCRKMNPTKGRDPGVFKAPRKFIPLSGAPNKVPLPDRRIRLLPSNSTTFQLYPNPSKNSIKVEATENIQAIEIYDSQGRMIKQIPGNQAKFMLININGIVDGVYIVRLNTYKGISTNKLVIQR